MAEKGALTDEQVAEIRSCVVKIGAVLIAGVVLESEGGITPEEAGVQVAAVMHDVACRVCAEAGMSAESVSKMFREHMAGIFEAREAEKRAAAEKRAERN